MKAMSFMPNEHSCLQCRPNLQTGPKGACPDDVQGGVNNSMALSGRRESNGRCVEYVRPLNASGECSSFMQYCVLGYRSSGHIQIFHSMANVV